MTPMIDVVFLLLVFFVCASIGQKPESLLPAELAAGVSVTDQQLPPEPPDQPPPLEARITLATDGQNGQLSISVNERAVPGAAELTRRLRELSRLDPRTRIILDVQDSVSVQQFIGIYDLCQVLKFDRISFAVRPPAQ